MLEIHPYDSYIGWCMFFNQVEIHPYFSNDKLVQYCQARGVTITAYSPFASPDRPAALPTDPVLFDEPKLKKVAEKHGKSTAQV